jgi:hypothetical protein
MWGSVADPVWSELAVSLLLVVEAGSLPLVYRHGKG